MNPSIIPSITDSPFNLKSPINVLRDIILHETQLDESRVNIYNQKFKIPQDDAMFIVLSLVGAKVYRSNAEVIKKPDTSFVEHKKLNMQEVYDISILSRNEDAMFKKEEVIMSLSSTYSQQTQEQYNFQIARIPGAFNDVSEVEGAARLYRFSIHITVLSWYFKETPVDYYDAFNGVVHTERIVFPFTQPVP